MPRLPPPISGCRRKLHLPRQPPPCRRSPRPPRPAAVPQPTAVPTPQPQKNYALLSDVQSAGIKDRLKLSASQESYWPPVESALRAVARQIHPTREAEPGAHTT